MAYGTLTCEQAHLLKHKIIYSFFIFFQFFVVKFSRFHQKREAVTIQKKFQIDSCLLTQIL